MRFLAIPVLAVVVSLLAARSFTVHHANSATSNAHINPVSPAVKSIPLNVVLTAYVPEPGSITSSGVNANSQPGIASHWGVLPRGTKITIKNVGTFVVDDRIPLADSEIKKYAVTQKDLRMGKRIHIDLRIVPRYRKGTDPKAAFKNAVAHADKIGRRKLDISIILPREYQRNG